MILYHITLNSNLNSIIDHGIDPEKSRGKLKVSWWVDETRIDWALAHVSARHNVPTCDLIIFKRWFDNNFEFKEFKRTRWYGVYQTDKKRICRDWQTANAYFTLIMGDQE
jgi:hypothetical protein